MTRLPKFVLPAAVLTLAPSALFGPALASAQEHAEPGLLPTAAQGVAPMVTALVVFLIVVVVLGKTAWPKINAGLAEREKKIREEILAAEAARKQAKDALEQYERSLAQARAEAQKMLEEARAQQQALADELKAKADVELNAMKERARRDIESAKRAALAEIFDKAADAATLMAGKILQREVSPADQRRLLAETVGELEALKN